MLKVTMKELKFATSEAFKEIRTNIMYGQKHVIGFTSISPSEGKTTITLQLARQFALLGKKVIVLECDLKRPSMHKALNVKRPIGLSELLTSQTNEVINQTEFGYDIIFAGKTPPNSTELLSSSTFKNLIKTLKKKYDFILIDTPPVSGTIDSQVIGGFVEGVVFVIKSNHTKREDLRRAIEVFKQSNIPVIGAVLNMASAGKNSGHYYYYNYGSEKN